MEEKQGNKSKLMAAASKRFNKFISYVHFPQRGSSEFCEELGCSVNSFVAHELLTRMKPKLKVRRHLFGTVFSDRCLIWITVKIGAVAA